MGKDIYTGKTILTDSKEHIIPNFLCGQLQPRGLIDKETNEHIGEGIDAALATALQSVRVLIDARSWREPERMAPPMKKVSGADGAQYVVGAGGTTNIQQEPITIREVDATLQFSGEVPDINVFRRCAQRIVRQFARKHALDAEVVMKKVLGTAEEISIPPVQLTFPIELWTTDPYRATAKIACNLLAMHETDLFLQHHFDDIREFILDGSQPSVPPVQAVDFDIIGCGMGNLDHLVVVEGRPTGEVVALVTYFGVLSFVVGLGTAPTLAGFKRSYRVDQLGRADRQDDLHELKLTVPDFNDASGRSREEFRRIVQAQMDRLVPVVLRIQRDIELRRIIEAAWKQADVGESGTLSTEAARELAKNIAGAVVAAMKPQLREAARQRHAALDASLTGDNGGVGGDDCQS